MKILHLISSKGFFGAENVVVNLAKEQKKNLDVCVGVFRDRREPHTEVAIEAERNGIKTEIFDCAGKIDIMTIKNIRKTIKEKEIDIVHSHGYKSNIYGILASRKTKVKSIATCHNWSMTDPKMRKYRHLDLFFMKKFDKIVAVSNRLKEQIESSGVKPDKISVIDNGVDIRQFVCEEYDSLFKKKIGANNSKSIICSIGRLVQEKGFFHLLKAFKDIKKSIPDTRLLIVGDGPLKEALGKAALELGISEKVTFAGIRNDISKILAITDIFVMASLDEGLPMVLLEAMAAKKPVVATRVGAIPDIIEDGQSGILVASGNELELSFAVSGLLLDKHKVDCLAEEGLKMIQEKYSSERMAGEYYKIYEECLSS
jgi:glycosyltransferase involved in cell wall biosynthesis